MKEKIEVFLQDVKVRKSFGTYDFYQSHLKAVLLYCELNNVDLFNDFNNSTVVNDYILYQRKKNNKNSTINKRLKVIEKINHFFDNKIKIELLKEKKERFKYIQEKDLEKIMNYVNSLDDTPYNINFKLIVYLLLSTGLRSREIICLEKVNINLERNYILVTSTKIDEDRIVFFKDDVKVLIQKNLALNSDTHYLFYNWFQMEEFHKNDLGYLIKKIKKNCNIKNLSPHMFRHTFASLLVKNGCPLFPIQSMLGHKSIKTTEIYVHQQIDNIHNAFDKYFY